MQHGILGVAHLPITSKTIFAWGESSKEQLISWGYAPERIMVLGRLKVSDEIENDFLDRSEVRTQFSKKYQMDPNKLIVGYFATDWDEDLNYELFKFFSTTLTNDIQVYVKIRPHRDHSRYYEKWLAELAPNKRVPIITDMEVREFFCASDVIVTDISSAGAEALLFDNASVLLDIYDFMKLSNLPHYKDCVVARNSQDLNSFFKRIIDQPDYLASLKKEGLVNARRHFMRHSQGSPARFIADHIMAEIG